MASNQEVFDQAAESYDDLALTPAEQSLLQLLGGRLPEVAMLDLGVGTGRTAYTFAGLVDRYVGLDYSPRMIAKAEALLSSNPRAELILADAATISPELGTFDVVLFSFNGIDAASPEDRRRILEGVRAVIKDDGWFQFSSHSIGALPFSRRRSTSRRLGGSRLYRLYADAMAIPYGIRVGRLNREIDVATARSRGWTVVRSTAHGFKIRDFYADPAWQVEELASIGFRVEKLLDRGGNEASVDRLGREPWFDYLCRPI